MRIFKNKIIYLDNASATPMDKEVARALHKYDSEKYGNAGAIHKMGVEARLAIEGARESIAKLMNAHADEIIFTGSGTESDSLAILGVINNYKLLITNKNLKYEIPHIVTTVIEHPAVLENCKMLEERGEAEVTYVGIDENGIVNPKDIRDAIKENTILVSVMYANNEIGTIQPIQEIAKEIRHFRKSGKHIFGEHGYFSAEKFLVLAPSRSQVSPNICFPLFHTDACQAMNYLFTENIEKLGVDLMSFNGSKIYGPKGVGVLFKKRGVELAPIYSGGGQEQGLRSGTENVAGIVGTAIAFEKVCRIKEKENIRLTKIRDYTIDKLLSLNVGYEIILNGEKDNRLPNNINISISGISSELLVIELDANGIMVSERSACSSDNPNGSYVIQALRQANEYVLNLSRVGAPAERVKRENLEHIHEASGSIRISLGRETTKQDMDYFIKALTQILDKYKKWE